MNNWADCRTAKDAQSDTGTDSNVEESSTAGVGAQSEDGSPSDGEATSSDAGKGTDGQLSEGEDLGGADLQEGAESND